MHVQSQSEEPVLSKTDEERIKEFKRRLAAALRRILEENARSHK